MPGGRPARTPRPAPDGRVARARPRASTSPRRVPATAPSDAQAPGGRGRMTRGDRFRGLASPADCLPPGDLPKADKSVEDTGHDLDPHKLTNVSPRSCPASTPLEKLAPGAAWGRTRGHGAVVGPSVIPPTQSCLSRCSKATPQLYPTARSGIEPVSTARTSGAPYRRRTCARAISFWISARSASRSAGGLSAMSRLP